MKTRVNTQTAKLSYKVIIILKKPLDINLISKTFTSVTILFALISNEYRILLQYSRFTCFQLKYRMFELYSVVKKIILIKDFRRGNV